MDLEDGNGAKSEEKEEFEIKKRAPWKNKVE